MQQSIKQTFRILYAVFLSLTVLSVFSMSVAHAQASVEGGEVSGVVTDDQGPVIGAAVMVKGTQNGVSTNPDGSYTLSGLQENDVIVVSLLGYDDVEVVWTGQAKQDFVLQTSTSFLDEVVVVGYGVQKKVNVTGSVSMVESDVLESRPVQNVSQALQGQIPGLNLNVGNSGGSLDSEMSINIRGAGTIGDGSAASPLVLIDGIEGNLNSINPNDIESVSVLKDASSSSIYGSRAAFGVILVTTKSGKTGRTNVSYSGNVRFNDAIGVPDMANSYDFATMFNAANINDGGSPIFNDAYMQNIKDYMDGKLEHSTIATGNVWAKWNEGAYDNIDWIKEFYKDWVPSHEHNVSVSGGTEKVQFFVSGNFLDQNGLSRHGKDDMQRYTLNGKISAQLADWAKLTYNTKWTREDYERPTYLTGLFFHNVARKWPIQPAYDPNGYPMNESEIEQMENGGRQNKQTDIFTNQVALVFEPLKDWHINLEGSVRARTEYQHWEVLPVYYYDVNGNPVEMVWGMGSGDYAAGQSRVNEYTYKENYYTTNIYTDYSKTFDSGHYFKVMVGFNAEKYSTRSITAQRDGLITPTVPTLNTALDADVANGGYAHYATAGFFGRINYNYKERYMLEINGRYDGSSRFVGDKQWGFFPSFSAGWNIAKEKFFTDAVAPGTVSTLKLRASWGELGNTNTNNWYPFYQTLPQGTNYSWIIDGSLPAYASNPGIVSSLLTWERVRSWDVALDFAFLNDRLTGSVGYFQRATLNMVGPAPELSSILGTSVPKINNCDMLSSGFELELSWRDQIGDFQYGARFTLSDARQRRTRYPNDTKSLANSPAYYEGAYLNDIWGYTTIGIAKSDEEMRAHLDKVDQTLFAGEAEWGAGDVMYADLNNNGRIDTGSNTADDPGDRRVIGNSTPRFNYGITLDAAWKGFDLRVFFQGVGKRDLWLSGPYFWGLSGGMWGSNVYEEHLDYWTPENTDAYYPRPTWSGRNQNTQTGYLQNGAYCRLKNITLGYTFPKKWMEKAKLQSIRIYVSADNVATMTSLSSMFDPEATGSMYSDPGKLYPLQRVISVGVNLNF